MLETLIRPYDITLMQNTNAKFKIHMALLEFFIQNSNSTKNSQLILYAGSVRLCLFSKESTYSELPAAIQFPMSRGPQQQF